MKNIEKITIIRNTRVKHPGGGGQDASRGDVFTVGENVSLIDARTLIAINKAVDGDMSEDYKPGSDTQGVKQPTETELKAMDAAALQEYVETIDVKAVSAKRLKLLTKLWKDAGIDDDFPGQN